MQPDILIFSGPIFRALAVAEMLAMRWATGIERAVASVQ